MVRLYIEVAKTRFKYTIIQNEYRKISKILWLKIGHFGESILFANPVRCETGNSQRPYRVAGEERELSKILLVREVLSDKIQNKTINIPDVSGLYLLQRSLMI